MTQIHLTLKTEFLKDLFMDDKGEASRKLVEKVIDALLNAEAEEQIGRTLYERSDNNQYIETGIDKEILQYALEL